MLVAGLEIAAGLALIGVLWRVLVLRRVRRRRRRRYELYELHLSAHDQAKPQDLEDMVESIANIVRAFPADRVRHGQPYVALELICGGRPETAAARNGVVDQRPLRAAIGRRAGRRDQRRLPGRATRSRHGEQPRPRAGGLREPGYVMRFRKERSFVYSLIADGEEQASSPLEQIARAQIAPGRRRSSASS